MSIVDDIKGKIKSAQHRNALAVNDEMVMLYWNIGTVINDHSVWGNKFIENLARDIKIDSPHAKGYSLRNLKYMSKFAKIYPDLEFVQRSVAQIPWRHNIVLIDKIKDENERNWYVQEVITNGWSRDWLVAQI